MDRLFDYLRNKHGLWFKLSIFLCSLFFIVWLLPAPNASSITYELGKPWQNEDLTAPFDFAVYKPDADVLCEQNNIKQNVELYYLANDTAFQKNIQSFFQSNKLAKHEQEVCAIIFNSLADKNIIELPDLANVTSNPKILVEKNKKLRLANAKKTIEKLEGNNL